MINKQNLWFVTLFSLIIILGIYYVSIDDEVAQVLKTEDTNSSNEVIEITESDVLVALEVENDEEKQVLMEEYQNILLSSESSLEEKNVAYENIQKINNVSQEETKIKNLLKDEFSLNSFVKINDNSINIVIASNDHNNEKANSIIRNVQKLYEEEKYKTVKYNT